ncbi:hypothetical protein CAP35_05250 [Chitinophagaceae bacterium IBVUCB1]|nr:hypothetical protein CAP35_05250 [Chitinophagaceae bacterium IBVUCB1]
MSLKQVVAIALLVLLHTHVAAQDSLLYLSKDGIISIVKKYHPVIKQADLKVRRMGAEVLGARGAFDPQVTAEGERKTFGGQEYYSYLNPELKIPTWYGIDIKAGAEEVYGTRVNSENTFGKSSYAGVNIAVMNGLLFDERRAALRTAQAYRGMSEVERRLTQNNILLEAIERYWNWVQAYNKYQLFDRVIAINKERLQFVRIEYEQGNRAAIDTTEATTQLQAFQLLANDAWTDFQNAGYELSAYLWLENNKPAEWSDKIVPENAELNNKLSPDNMPALQQLITQAYSQHPKLNVFEYKLNVLEIEKRLKQQEFLPKLDVKANMLNKGYNMPNDFTTNFLENNYKAGFEFKMPLFYRKAIGSYRAAKFKIMETQLEQDYTALQIENKIKVYYTEVLNLYRQINLYEDAYLNFARMYNAEMVRYEVGESTLFLINSRENKLLEAQQKLIELKAKWHIKYSTLLWSAGII